jgi:hypothetical protein
MVVRAKFFSPQENRIRRAQAVNDHGQQEKMAVNEPGHDYSFNFFAGPVENGTSSLPSTVCLS